MTPPADKSNPNGCGGAQGKSESGVFSSMRRFCVSPLINLGKCCVLPLLLFSPGLGLV